MIRTKKSRVLSLLLDPDNRPKTKYGMAQTANCTPSWVIMLTKELEKKGALKGLKVIDTKKIFDEFTKSFPKNGKREAREYSVQNQASLFEWLKKNPNEYALTTYAAENQLQHYLFLHKIELYVNENDWEKWHNELSEKGTYGGGNVKIIKGLWTVNTAQLLYDLYKETGPAAEAADMLLAKIKTKLEGKQNVF
jgi:hypothetical protein